MLSTNRFKIELAHTKKKNHQKCLFVKHFWIEKHFISKQLQTLWISVHSFCFPWSTQASFFVSHNQSFLSVMKLRWIIDSCRQFNSRSVYYEFLEDSAGPERAGSKEKNVCVHLLIRICRAVYESARKKSTRHINYYLVIPLKQTKLDWFLMGAMCFCITIYNSDKCL